MVDTRPPYKVSSGRSVFVENQFIGVPIHPGFLEGPRLDARSQSQVLDENNFVVVKVCTHICCKGKAMFPEVIFIVCAES